MFFHSAKNAEEETAWITSRIKVLRESGTAYRDMSILYRAHYVTRPVEEALLKEKLPYHIYSGVPFFSRVEIKDALCCLRMAVLQDDLSFRKQNRRRMAFLEQYAVEHECSLYNALKQTLDNEIFKRTKADRFVRQSGAAG